MKKYRYRYQHDHLDFVKIKISFRDILLKALFYILLAVFVTIVYYFIYSLFFDTPEERRLKRENLLLKEQHEQLRKRYDQVETIMTDLSARDQEIYRAIFHADLSFLHRESLLADYSVINNDGLTKETMKKMWGLQRRALSLSVLLDEMEHHLMKTPADSLLMLPLIQPVENKGLTRIGASLGKHMHPFYKLLKEHNGVDFIAGLGTNVYATANGIVRDVFRLKRGHGHKVEIDHGNGYITVYAHLSDILVKPLQSVKRGQVIAKVGNTGSSVVPHLHYEVLKNGQYMDPLNYFFIGLRPEEYESLIQLSNTSGQSLD
jgi:hypothetical protein